MVVVGGMTGGGGLGRGGHDAEGCHDVCCLSFSLCFLFCLLIRRRLGDRVESEGGLSSEQKTKEKVQRKRRE